ncbi:hypothetical protein ACCS68_28995 [Rhizobium beringeri]|uniref:hypothetical protein n=1 Tax=Rhizobium TaxID=379 RepID=UPI0010320B85|nr:hypothetical protein [Rhizobium leguminosarum]TAW53287.1 hypothetical protein ELI14_19285 [Rhizobium leguminosarum]
MIPTIVFHWQRIYSQAAHVQAVLDGREPTIDDMIADDSRQPIYRFSAFAVPVPSVQELHRFCRLIETAGFRKDKKSASWIAPIEGEEPVAALKAALDHAKVSTVHYHDIPLTFTVSVNLDGLL